MSTDVLAVSSSSEKSTNVRPHGKLEEAMYAAGRPLRALLAVSPWLAGRMAARAFFTTYRPPMRPEEQAVLEAAAPFEVRFGRRMLPAWELGEGPTVLLTHGWSGRASQMAPLAAALATAGFRAVVFDHPGHGRAEGTSSTLPEMRDALSEVDGWIGGAHAVIAHSMGTIFTTLAMARTIEPRRVVYLAPPIVPESWPRDFARKLGLGPAIDEPLRKATEARAGVTLASLDPRPIARQLETPLLVVHDRADREVRFSEGEALVRMWRGAALHATEGLGHLRILRDPAVGERVLSFLSPLVR